MICSSTDDVVLCSTRSAADVAMPSRTVRESSTMEREETQATGALVNTGVITEESTRRYDVKLDDVLSVRSSIVSNASVGDLKREQLTTTTRVGASNASSPSSHDSAAAAGPRSKTRLEEKIRMIAHYIKSMSMGFKHRHPSTASDAYANSISSSGSRRQRSGKKSKKDVQSTTRVTKRRSQVSLSQYSQPRSAPDVLEDQKPTKSRANDVSNNSSNMTARCSNSSEQTSLSWEEICVGAVLVEENEVMPASPRSRKRGRRAIELFEELELRRLCGRCDVPPSNVAEVVKMVLAHFGTCQFDVTVFHDLVGGNSVVVIGMLVFMCIDSNEEFLDLHRLPLFLHYLQTRYNERNPFHNACHAADVLHSLFTMMWCTELCSRVAIHNQIGVLFAAIMHDIEHIGLTNDFLLKTNHEIAIQFPTRAPMEEMHLTVALEVLADPKFHVLSKMSNDQQEQVLGIVRDTIRSTALCYQKEMLCDIAEVSTDDWVKHDVESVLPLKLQTLALRIAMHVSDISQTMKPFYIHNKWVNRLNEELFLQGDLDQQMSYSACPESCFRDKWTEEAFLNSQVWFLRNLALPAAQGFNSIPWLHATFLEDNLHANILAWEAQLAAIAISKA